MSVIVILLSVSLCIAGGFLLAFWWSVDRGQYDDSETPAQRAIFDDNQH